VTGVLFWKEYREHRAVWLTLAVVAALSLVGVKEIFAPEGLTSKPELRDLLRSVALMLAWTYGVVCGSMMLAGEREGGTQEFLDTLPARRLSLWLHKCLFGLLFLAAQMAVVLALGLWLGLAENRAEQLAGVLFVAAFGLTGYFWGLLFSAMTANVLNAIGLSIAGQFLAVAVVAPLAVILGAVAGGLLQSPVAGGAVTWAVPVGLLLVAPILWSARRYSRLDRQRRLAPEKAAAPMRPVWSAWHAAWWLSFRQMRRLMLGLFLFCLLVGLLVPFVGIVLWPILTLGIGALCGVSVYGDEQAGGARSFLADQRFPLGRVWFVKALTRFGLAAAACLILLLPSLVASGIRMSQVLVNDYRDTVLSMGFGSPLLRELVPGGMFLGLFVVYGFTIGMLCGQLFRKSLVAIVLALGCSTFFIAVWSPSMLGGGLKSWQVLGVPLAMLVASYSLMYLWTAGRAASWATVVRLGLAALVSVVWVGAGLAYRVVEVPAVAEPAAFQKFVESMPAPERNEAGLMTRGALIQVGELIETERQQQRSMMQRANQTLSEGWPPDNALARMWGDVKRRWGRAPAQARPLDNAELGRWLNGVFRQEWPQRLDEAADKRPGVIEDPRMILAGRRTRLAPSAHVAAVLLAARGLQKQAEGDPAVFVKNLRSGLALTRNLQHRSVTEAARYTGFVESAMLHGLDRWLERLDGRPDLLRQALDLLTHHDASLPTNYAAQAMADYLVMRNSLDAPEDWLTLQMPPVPGTRWQVQPEIAILKLAWLVPWERERQERLLRVRHWGKWETYRGVQELASGVIPAERFRIFGLRQAHFRRLCSLRAAILMVALRLYEAEQKKPADAAADLVPRYLAAVPPDPFDGRPFRYRLSRGEEIDWPSSQQAQRRSAMPRRGSLRPAFDRRFVPPGQGIVWSVGEDGRDDNAKRNGRSATHTTPGQDIVFLVPPPPGKAR
jgi:hypothetical protein